MATQVSILARVRKVLEAIDGEAQGAQDTQLTLTQQLELLTAAGTSPYGEITRAGHAYWASRAAAIAAVVAVPTTAVGIALYNGEPDGGRSLVIDWIGATGAAKTAAAGQAQLLVLSGQIRETQPPGPSSVNTGKSNGIGTAFGGTLLNTAADSRAIVVFTNLPATTGFAGAWLPWGPAVGFPGAAATPGHGLWAAVDGRFICPPGRYFAMNIIADVVGSTFIPAIGWHEKQIVLG